MTPVMSLTLSGNVRTFGLVGPPQQIIIAPGRESYKLCGAQ
jgi:hypothetical protein